MHFLFNCSIILIGLMVVCACRGSQGSDTDANSLLEGLPKGFEEFYNKFHDDTAYQMRHIAFPLSGRKGRDFIEAGAESTWSRDEWIPHRRITDLSTYQMTFNILNDELVIETVRERNGPNAMQRRYAVMSDGWNLIYYIEMQPLVSEGR